jgi:hypothetical protein
MGGNEHSKRSIRTASVEDVRSIDSIDRMLAEQASRAQFKQFQAIRSLHLDNEQHQSCKERQYPFKQGQQGLLSIQTIQRQNELLLLLLLLSCVLTQ